MNKPLKLEEKLFADLQQYAKETDHVIGGCASTGGGVIPVFDYSYTSDVNWCSDAGGGTSYYGAKDLQ